MCFFSDLVFNHFNDYSADPFFINLVQNFHNAAINETVFESRGPRLLLGWGRKAFFENLTESVFVPSQEVIRLTKIHIWHSGDKNLLLYSKAFRPHPTSMVRALE